MKIIGDGPFGQCGVPPSHDGTTRGQSPLPTFKMSELARDMTLTVHIRIIHDWRFRLGLWLVRIGARLAGFAVRTTELPSDDAQ